VFDTYASLVFVKEKMPERHVVTSIAEAPDSERKRRMIKYTISMTVRTLCVILVVFTSGVWQWVFGLGAVFLPYFAVVLANTAGQGLADTQSHRRVEPLQIDVAAHVKRHHE
jgi:predicted tellurium resistance membrane protein TerC